MTISRNGVGVVFSCFIVSGGFLVELEAGMMGRISVVSEFFDLPDDLLISSVGTGEG